MAQDNFNNTTGNEQFPPVPADHELHESDVHELLAAAPVGMPDPAVDQAILALAANESGLPVQESEQQAPGNVVSLYKHQEETSFGKVLPATFAAAAVVMLAVVVVPMMTTRNQGPNAVTTLASADMPDSDSTADGEVLAERVSASSNQLSAQASNGTPGVARETNNTTDSEAADSADDSDAAGIAEAEEVASAANTTREMAVAEESEATSGPVQKSSEMVVENVTVPTVILPSAAPVDAIQQTIEVTPETNSEAASKAVSDTVSTIELNKDALQDREAALDSDANAEAEIAPEGEADVTSDEARRLEFLANSSSRQATVQSGLPVQSIGSTESATTDSVDPEQGETELVRAKRDFEEAVAQTGNVADTSKEQVAKVASTGVVTAEESKSATQASSQVVAELETQPTSDEKSNSEEVASRDTSGAGTDAAAPSVARTTIVSTEGSARPKVVQSINMAAGSTVPKQSLSEQSVAEQSVAEPGTRDRTDAANEQAKPEPGYRRSLYRWKSEILKLSRQGKNKMAKEEYVLFRERHPTHTINIKGLRGNGNTAEESTTENSQNSGDTTEESPTATTPGRDSD